MVDLKRSVCIKIDYNVDLEVHLKREHSFDSQRETFKIISKSLDARGANRGVLPKYLYNIEIFSKTLKNLSFQNVSSQNLLAQKNDLKNLKTCEPYSNIIVGCGPAGLFAALRLLDYGIIPLIIERGAPLQERIKKVTNFWKTGDIDLDSNVSFGEGGAGLFSDGKLLTRVKSPHSNYVLTQLIRFGAQESILYDAHPHVGTDRMRLVIKNLVNYLTTNNVKIIYNDPLVDYQCGSSNKIEKIFLRSGKIIDCSKLILATGHSARDIYNLLHAKKVALTSKPFAMGVRIEHPRKEIEKLQFGKFAGDRQLESARYRLSFHNSTTNRGTYTFCMCPGGVVLSAASNNKELVVNGMSSSARNSKWSNSAIIVSVNNVGEKLFDDISNIFQGLKLQQQVEFRAYQLASSNKFKKELPALSVREFLEDKIFHNQKLPPNSVASGLFKTSFHEIFPEYVINHLKDGLVAFNRDLPGFISPSAILIAPETRTSSPIRIERDKDSYASITCSNLYPCGEGPGYAGGITSSAIDGVNVADSILRSL